MINEKGRAGKIRGEIAIQGEKDGSSRALYVSRILVLNIEPPTFNI